TVGGQTFTGPLRVTNRAEMEFFDALWRGRKFTENGLLGGELTFGLTYGGVEYVTTAPGQRGTENVKRLGGNFGVGGLVRFRPGTSVHARYSWYVSDGLFTETGARRFDVSLVQALGRNAMLRAGYASWQFSTEPNGSAKLNAHLSGPTLGVEVGF